jgi:ATP-dependent DNA helicase RecG
MYYLPGQAILTPDDVFGPMPRISAPSSPNLAASSPNLGSTSRNLAENRDPLGCLISEQLSLPVVDELEPLSEALRSRLEVMASEPRSKGKVDRQMLIDVGLHLCEGRFVTLRCLAELVKRKPDTLRDQYLKTLVRQRKIRLAFPKTPNHERQACTTVKPSL